MCTWETSRFERKIWIKSKWQAGCRFVLRNFNCGFFRIACKDLELYAWKRFTFDFWSRSSDVTSSECIFLRALESLFFHRMRRIFYFIYILQTINTVGRFVSRVNNLTSFWNLEERPNVSFSCFHLLLVIFKVRNTGGSRRENVIPEINTEQENGT